MRKRIISLMLSVSIIMGLFGVFPMSVNAETSGYYTYTVSEGNAKITDVDAAISGDITIPSKLGGYPVTSIGGHAFDYCYSLVSINIPDSVTSIDTGAFYGCESLVSIDIPDSVTSIGYGVFSNCTSLVSINIPDSVTSIGASAFYGCESLVSIDIPDSVTSIGSDMFYRCTSLVSIDIPDGVTSIGYGAFTKCYSLVNIDIPDSVTSIGDDAFYSCESLVSINIPDSVTSIGNRAFIWCKSLVSIDIPDSVISIGDHVFSYCYSLVSIDIPESVTSIGDHVFCYCYRLVSINIPESVTSIGSSAFFGCDSLTDVYYGGSESDWSAIDIGSNNDSLLNAMIHYNSGSETAELNSGITINSSGVAFARFALKDMSGKPYANKTVSYTIDGYNFTDTTATDENGVATVKTPYLSGAGETKTLTVRFDDANLKSNTYRFDVYIKDLSFLQTWQGKINVGAGVEAAFGVSGKLGVAEGEAKLASIGADIKSSRGLSLTNSYNDGVRSLLLASNISSDIGVEGKLGMFAEASFTGIKGAEISVGDVSGGARTGGSHEVALNIENYNPNNEEHVAQIGFFLLDCMSQMSGSNVLIRSILNTFDIATYNEKTVGTAAHLQAGAKLGAIEAGNFSADLVGVGADTVWTYKAKEDKDGKNEYSSKITTDAGISFGNVGFKVKGDKGASGYTPSGSASESIFSHEFLNNELEFSATENGGELEEFEITMLAENNNNSILWYEENEDYNQVFSYKGDDADIVVAANDKLKEFTNGEKGWFSTWAMADAAQDALNSDVDADYTKEKEISQGIDAYLNFGLTALLGFEFGLGFSGIESNSYDIEDGISEDNVLYIQSQSDIDSAVEAEEMTLLEIFQEPINTVSNAIKDTFDNSVAGKIGDGIEQGMAKIKGTFNGLVSIFTPKSTNAALSYKVLAIDSDTASLATSSVASTLGSPYVIKAEDDGGNIITEFADGEVVLELSYDSGMLASAGVSDNETALDGLKIYRWDDTKSVYINLGGTLDYENSKVELAITKPGQYILAYDNCAPSVTQFASLDYSATPVITAEVADLSGISEFEFKIDGNTVVDAETFDDYYTYSTAVFKYSVDGPLADGEHIATIYATDTSGNEMLMPAELEFTVDTIAPVISDVMIPQKAIGTLELSAVVDDDDVEVVNAYIKTDSKTYCYAMENNSGIWEIEISRLPECESADVYLAAFDIYENESRTEVASVEIQNFIKGDAMKDGKINNLDSIRIAQHIAWGIKLSDYELKAADVNDDKRVNNLDLIKLAQKLAGWTIEW